MCNNDEDMSYSYSGDVVGSRQTVQRGDPTLSTSQTYFRLFKSISTLLCDVFKYSI